MIKYKKLHPNAQVPTLGSPKAAGYDLYACLDEDVISQPHTTAKIGTGLAFAPPEGFCLKIYARSGMATKLGARPANCTGVCDEDYRGEYIVAVHNDSLKPVLVQHGDRIAQMLIEPYYHDEFVEGELDDTERGTGGFGSSGK